MSSATVTTGTTPVTPRQVNFCDAAAKYCIDIHLLGIAQLTQNGTAALKFRAGAGSHSYKAIFVGTTDSAPCASTALTLVVTPTIAASDSPNSYFLTATVSGNGNVSPTGTVSFLKTSDANEVLGTAVLTPVTAGPSFSNACETANFVESTVDCDPRRQGHRPTPTEELGGTTAA